MTGALRPGAGLLSISTLLALAATAVLGQPAFSQSRAAEARMSVWYAPAPVTSPRFAWPVPTEGASVDAHILAGRQVYAARFDARARRPFVERVEATGARVIHASWYAPVAVVAGDAAALEQVAELPEVAWMEPAVEYEQEQDSSARTVRVYEVAALPLLPGHITGSGVAVCVLEAESVQQDHPYLPDVTWITPPPGVPVGNHPTAVAGIIASQHPLYRGLAPGVTLLNANASSFGTAQILAASDWALSQGAHTINASFGTDTLGSPQILDHYFDHVVRHHHVSFIKGAGNGGGHVSSPGLGFNSITVGNSDDDKTPFWWDDVMNPSSGYLDPSTGQPKPEIVAPATALWGLLPFQGADDWTGFIGSGASYAGPQANAVAALLMERDDTLKLWPEAIKAALLASAWHKLEPGLIGDRDGVGQLNACAADAVVRSGAERLRHGQLTPASFDGNGHLDLAITLVGHSPTRAVVSWDSNPAATFPYVPNTLQMDLDLVVLDPALNPVAAATDHQASFEIVHFIPAQSGSYTFRLVSVRFDGTIEPYGLAVSQELDSPGPAWPLVWTDLAGWPW